MRNSIRVLGASNHSDGDREENDYYATDPVAIKWLLELESFDKSVPILEPAAGGLHMVTPLREAGYTVGASDVIARQGCTKKDFFNIPYFHGNIITNPPYKVGKEFVEHALSIVPEGRKVAMFLKILFLESQGRKKLFQDNPPVRVWISSSRISCAKNGDFDSISTSAQGYAWYIWEKGYIGETILKWFN